MGLAENELVILGAFGRGQWLAAERARKGQGVTLIDVSESLGHWTPEDWEGPFGFFRPQDGGLATSQLERLLEDDIPESLASGFTIWPKSGPLELKGALTQHRLDALGLSAQAREYITEFYRLGASENKDRQAALSQQEFSKVWLAAMAQQLSSSRYYSNRQSLSHGHPLPLFSSFFMRQATRPGYQRSLNWAQQSGVDVLSGAKVIDFSFSDSKNWDGIEIKSQSYSGVVKGREFIWMLSSLETKSIGSSLPAKVFKDEKVLEPQWCWQRFRIGLKACHERDVLPVHFVFVENLELPWSHDNIAIVSRTYSAENFDVWMRLPYSLRFGKSHLEEVGQSFIEKLNARIPKAQAFIQEYPQEYGYSFDVLGAPRFPVYDKAILPPEAITHNTILDGPEHWPRLDWLSQMAVHRRHSRNLEKSFQDSIRKEAEL